MTATALMLSFAGAPFNVSFLAWIALVPFVFACRPDIKPIKLFFAALIVGYFYWVLNLYWLWYVTGPGHLAVCLYLAAYWAILSLAVAFCRSKRIPMMLAVPILWVGAETLHGSFPTAFGWRFLSHTQYLSTSIVQIADIFGAAGISFLIGMFNGALADALIDYQNKKRPFPGLAKIAVAGACVIAATLYGNFRLDQAKTAVTKGPLVASVQSNIPLEVKESQDQSEDIFVKLMTDSRVAADAKPVLIAWPETMVQAHLDPELLDILSPATVERVFDKLLREHAKGKTHLLVGAEGGVYKQQGERIFVTKRYNSAFMYLPDGNQFPARYDKMHLVPFGEVVPFKYSVPWLYKILMTFTPYEYDYSLDYGSRYTVFDVNDSARRYRFGVLICYEDTMPYVGRGFSIDPNGNKQVDWLVNISNDGWFVRFRDSKVIPSTELEQHAAVGSLRAIENRLPILRSVNTGISCLIDSSGRILDGFAVGRIPQKAMDRKGVAGWFADYVPLDSRVTFFSRHGQWLDFSCLILFAGCVITQFVLFLKTRRQIRKSAGKAQIEAVK